ncbi:AAA family ATPase [Mammaliicoccus sciuri]
MDKVYKLINEIKEILFGYREFVSEYVLSLENIEEMNKYINFLKISDILNEFDKEIEKLIDLEFSSKYNENFINYINEERSNFEHQFNNYENIKRNSSKIKNNEIIYENIKVQREYIGYGGGRAPLNKDEELIYDFVYFENNMIYLLESINNFINNLYILKDFSELNTNVVIIGANGSGKSTLSRRLKLDNINQSINIIPSHHILYLSQQNYVAFENSDDYFDVNTYQEDSKMVTIETPFNSDEFNHSFYNLMNYLIIDHYSKKGDSVKSKEEKTKLETVIDLCNSLIKKNIILDKHIIKCLSEDNEIYDFNQMSDGERQVFYFVASVLANENDGYIIVDEPENHLNSQVCKLLWDKLEVIKSDSTFVYITHDPKFAVSRINSKLIWSKSFIYPNVWDYEILEEDEIPEELLIEVLGSKENIIFCEGESDSIDKQLYEAIFFDDKVIAVGGHLNVINYTKAINNISNLNIKAKGLIDRDGKTEEEINKYKENNINVLPFNEIEMLLLSKEVLEELNKVISVLDKGIDIEQWKNRILQICDERKEKILLDIVKSRVENLLSSKKLQNCKEFNELYASFKMIFDSIDLDKIYNAEKLKLEVILKNKEYENLLKICNLKKEILMGVPSREGYKDYHKDAVALIQNNNVLKEILKKKYFSNF